MDAPRFAAGSRPCGWACFLVSSGAQKTQEEGSGPSCCGVGGKFLRGAPSHLSLLFGQAGRTVPSALSSRCPLTLSHSWVEPVRRGGTAPASRCPRPELALGPSPWNCVALRVSLSLAGVNLTEVFVDTVGDADRYQQRLAQRFPSLKFKGAGGAEGGGPEAGWVGGRRG